MQPVYKKRDVPVMERRFQRRQITIPLCFEQHLHGKACLATRKPCAMTVTELIGTGLAIQQVHDAAVPGRFKIVHTASGTLISARSVSNVVEAGRWIRAIAPLCDWTQPVQGLQPPPAAARQVEEARKDAVCATSNLLSWTAMRKQGYRHPEQDEW